MNIIERYLGKVLIGNTLVVMLVLLIILVLSDFMIQIGDLTEQYTITKGLFHSILRIPIFAYEIFPLSILIGALLGLGSLANHAELTVLRVTGWPVKRIFWAVMKSVFVLWVVATLIGETIAPTMGSYAKKIRGEALNKNFSIGSKSSLWMKEEDRYIFVGKTLSATKLLDIKIYRLKDNQIVESLFAKSAEFKNKQWHLNSIKSNKTVWQKQQIKAFENHNWKALSYKEQQQSTQVISLPIKPELLQSLNLEVRHIGVLELNQYISFLEKNNLDAETYQLAFWRKIASPFVIFGMIAIVFPLVFGSQRQVSIGQRVFVGILIGMGFHLLNQIFGNLSVVYNLSPITGAFLPSLILITIALLLMKRRT